MPSSNVIGPQVKKARLARKTPMTQDDLSIKLQMLGWQIDRFGVSKIERGERQVTDKELLLLARALNVPPSLLLESADPSS
jgi:transcriptional regulator with XRE-family HTH domain